MWWSLIVAINLMNRFEVTVKNWWRPRAKTQSLCKTRLRWMMAATLWWSELGLELPWMAASPVQTFEWRCSLKNFFSRPFLYCFCALGELQKVKIPFADEHERPPFIEANSLDQYGCGKNMRIFGVAEEPDENVIPKLVRVPEEDGVTITAIDVTACHRLTDGGEGLIPVSARFVQHDTKHQLKK